jgi:carnitine monooxygenase subunit
MSIDVHDFSKKISALGFDLKLFHHLFNPSQNETEFLQAGRAWIYKSGINELFKIEVETIFLNSWHFVGLANEIPRPGDYFTWNAFNYSFIIIRNDSLEIKCFLNSCIHRGSALCAEKKGNLKNSLIQCPYHFWKFNLDGKLLDSRKALGPESEVYLRELQVDLLFNNLVFIKPNVNSDVPRISEKYAMLDRELKNYQIQNMRMIAEITSDFVPAKWSVVLENNQESYHAINHQEYLELFDGGINSDFFYKFTDKRGHFKSKNVADYLSLVDSFPKIFPNLLLSEIQGWNFYYLYPNTGITVTPHEIQIDQILPIDSRSSEIRSYRFGLLSHDSNIIRLRHLGNIIDENVKAEDLILFPKIQLGINGADDETQFHLTQHEVGVSSLFQYLIRMAPVLGLKKPQYGSLREINFQLLAHFSEYDSLRSKDYHLR